MKILFKKTYVTFLLISSLLLSFAGCSGKDEVIEDNLTSYNISIPGISREYSFLFITDTHIIEETSDSDSQIQEYSNQRAAGFRQQQNGIDSISLVQWSEFAVKNNYDGLLLGGDIIDSPSSSNLDSLNSSLKNLQIPYLYTLGNHDWTYPWEYMTENGKEQFLPLFEPYMDGNTAIHSIEYEDFIITAIDNSGNQINPEALAPYRKILEKGKPVIVLLHVPLYTEELFAKTTKVWDNGVVLSGGIHGGIYPDEASAQFLQLTLAQDSPVAAIAAGHVHLEDSSMVLGNKNIPQIVGNAGYMGKGTIINITDGS